MCVPCKIVPKIRVRDNQQISVLNQVKLFSNNNKMVFISKGLILPYKKSIKDCNLNDGDVIFGLNIKLEEKNFFLLDILNSDKDVDFSQIKNKLSIFGPAYEANLMSINKAICDSQNDNDLKKRVVSLKDKSIVREMAKLDDLKNLKKEENRFAWRKRKQNFLAKKYEEFNFKDIELSNVNYDKPDEPSCDPLPLLMLKKNDII